MPWLPSWASGAPGASTSAASDAPRGPPVLAGTPDEDIIPELKRRPEPVILPFSTLLVTSAVGIGFTSGFISGARHMSLVYLAENAHRRPETVQGWYFYNKTKYYKMLLAGFRRGAGTGLQLAGWVGGWCLLDVLNQEGRVYLAEKLGQPPTHGPLDAWGLGHWLDGAVAGFSTGLVGTIACKFSSLTSDRLSASTVPKMLLLGTAAGASTGAFRDLREMLLRERTSPS